MAIGAGTSAGFGAMITAESGPVRVGAGCVIMENAVLRGVEACPLDLGDHVLVGSYAHLSRHTVRSRTFLAIGSSATDGATIGRAADELPARAAARTAPAAACITKG